MLDSKDLRIGNWVLKVSGTDRNSTSFFEYKPISVEEYLFSTARDSFPILLTSDILGKAGFTHDSGDWFKNVNAVGIDEEPLFLRYKSKVKSWYLKGVKIPAQPVYLHQLQNLVYALSNIELHVQLGHFENLPSLKRADFFPKQKAPFMSGTPFHTVFLKDTIS